MSREWVAGSHQFDFHLNLVLIVNDMSVVSEAINTALHNRVQPLTNAKLGAMNGFHFRNAASARLEILSDGHNFFCRGWCRAVRHFRSQRFDALAIKIHKQWREIVRGDVRPEEWRYDSMQSEIVQSIVIQEISAATDKDRAGLQEFLRANGLVASCIEKVQSGHGWARRRAMLALGAMRVPEAIAPLTEELDDWQLDTRMAAVQSLGRTHLPEAAESIIESFMVGGLKVPLDPIANALVRCFKDRPAALMPFLRRSLGESRELLARVAIELATPGMADEMLILAADPQPEVRASAAKALAVAALQVSIPALADLARDESWFVRLRATIALNEIPRDDLCPRTRRRFWKSDVGTCGSTASRPDRRPTSRGSPRRRRGSVDNASRRSRGGIGLSVKAGV
jgi:HEAT repeats/PBS lyase HEAT-like repeat